MSRRANGHVRCPRCRLHLSLCLCEHLVPIETKTRILLVLHRREEKKPTNTGRLALECLPNSQVWVRGVDDGRDRTFALEPGRQALLLFPDAAARPLSDFVDSPRPLTLVVPDGTWRQAAKARSRLPALSEVPLVALPPGPPTLYRLRKESHDGGLATMEAIGRALGVLEGPEIRARLERVFRIMVERALWARGSLTAAELTEPLPEHAQRHDPLSGVD
jgi:DTW domain-containing protein